MDYRLELFRINSCILKIETDELLPYLWRKGKKMPKTIEKKKRTLNNN